MNIDDELTQQEREARRLLIMKRVLEVLGWLTAVALFAFAGHAVFAAGRAQGHAPATRAFDDAGRAQRVGSQDDAGAGRERARKTRGREDLSPGALARGARAVYVAPSGHVEKKYLEYKLGKYAELRDWGLVLVADPEMADLVLTVDKTALNYIFTLTDRRTSVIVTTGKCVAVNGRLAAEYLGKEIVKKLRDVRASGDGGRDRRRDRDDSDDDEWGAS
jgi:hypothetical protein